MKLIKNKNNEIEKTGKNMGFVCKLIILFDFMT